MKHILLNGLGCNLSGGRNVLKETISGFREKDCILVVFMTGKKFVHSFPKQVKILRVNHFIFGRLLRPLVDLILCFYAFLPFVKLYYNLSNYGFANKKTVVYLHTPILLESDYSSVRGGQNNFYKQFALKHSIRNSSMLIVQTQHMAYILKEYISRKSIGIKGKIKVMTPLWSLPVSSSSSSLKKEYGFQFFYPTSTFAHKNPELAVDSVEKNDLECGLIITTKSECNTKKIKFIGQISHARCIDYIKASDALLFTSSKETLGLPLLEAMQLGLPAVIPNLPYARELYGKAGVYFESFEVHSISKAIAILMDDYEKYCMLTEERWVELEKDLISWKQQWNTILSRLC